MGPEGGRGPQGHDAPGPLCLLPPARSHQLGAVAGGAPLEPSAVTARLVTLVVTQRGDKLQVHGASWLGTDTTLVAKTATRMPGVQQGYLRNACHFPLAVRCPAKFTLLDGTCDFLSL